MKYRNELSMALLAVALDCGPQSGRPPASSGIVQSSTSGGSTFVGQAGSSSRSIPTPPSCQPGGDGMTNCGSSGTESCCTSLEVAGGAYYRTYTNSGSGPTGQADPATVSGFRLDKYLVTVGRFRQFVRAWNAGWLPPSGSGNHAHLNGGQGLVNAGPDAGVVYEPGWVASDNSNIAPTNANLTDRAHCWPYTTWTPSAGSNENLPIDCVNWFDSSLRVRSRRQPLSGVTLAETTCAAGHRAASGR